MRNVLAMCAILISSACTTNHQARIDYSAYNIYASGQAGNKSFKDIGPVTGSKYSLPWTDCAEVTVEAIKNMLDEAKSMGGNTVYDVKFYRDGTTTQIPTCSRVWIPVPYFASAMVTGIAAKIEKPEVKSSSITIPKDGDTRRIAREWLDSASKEPK